MFTVLTSVVVVSSDTGIQLKKINSVSIIVSCFTSCLSFYCIYILEIFFSFSFNFQFFSDHFYISFNFSFHSTFPSLSECRIIQPSHEYACRIIQPAHEYATHVAVPADWKSAMSFMRRYSSALMDND